VTLSILTNSFCSKRLQNGQSTSENTTNLRLPLPLTTLMA
jgi:hypothetical protein